jgi:Zn-dependent protease
VQLLCTFIESRITMFRSWKLGSLFGIGIYVHATFLLLPALVFLANVGTGQIGMALYAVMMIPAVFSCVVLHELGHALTARRYGIETRDITLYPIGGVARLERLPRRPMEEFWIAVAGPAVNVAIAALVGAFLWLASGWNLSFFAQNISDTVLGHLFIINVGLALFNMLPAFPMDGGRVLRALLATHLGQFRATTIAVQIGVAMAVLFAIAGLFSGLTLTLVGVFVFFAGQQELAAARYRHAYQSREPLDVLPAHEDVYDWPTPPASRAGFSGFTWDSGSGRWIEWRNGRPVHTISVS